MDFPVEATVHLNNFPSGKQVQEILRSHGLEVTGLSSDRVRVKGTFFQLKAAKASLEPLLNSQTKTPSAFSPVPNVSSGAIPKNYANNDGNRSLHRNKSSYDSPSSPATSPSWVSCSPNNRPTSPEYRTSFSPRPDQGGSFRPPSRVLRTPNNRPTSPEYGTSFSPRPDQRGSFRSGRESFVVDADAFEYANWLRKKEMDDIVDSHGVFMERDSVGDNYSITIHGKSAKIAAGKLQSFLNGLCKSLRTQEVHLSDMDRDGRALLERIQKGRNIYNLVLVCRKNDQVHLIGPSGESYELKQRLLGRPVEQSGRTGRTFDRNSRARSSSLPPMSRKSTKQDSGGFANSSPIRAAGYSPSKYQDDKPEPKRGVAAHFDFFSRRSHSESRQKTQAQRANGYKQDMENKPSPKSPNKIRSPLLIVQDIKQKFKNRRR